MDRKLYFGQPWNEPGYLNPWVSFEDNPQFALTGVKSKFCRACLKSLRKGLLSYKVGQGVALGPSMHCWKAVLNMEGLNDPEESRRLLEIYQDDFLAGESKITGKIGGGETPSQQQIMMHCDNAVEAGAYLNEMAEWLRKYHGHPLNSYSVEQGCKHPFLELFGPVSARKQRMEPISPAVIPKIIDLYLQDEQIAHRR
ncbi:MAG: hypothetical protein GWP14_07180 [Actinobacteria bacterium]|nr:hypothetical protein [Actinomycetota bacterium]